MSVKQVATNKKAFHDFFITETFEAGLVLTGTEVKSLRTGKVNLREAFCRMKGGEIFVDQMHISPYEHGNRENPDPVRTRKLLLHKQEIGKLERLVEEKGLALVPTRLYFKRGRAKLEIGLARGKKLYDKRESLKRKEADREMENAVRFRNRS